MEKILDLPAHPLLVHAPIAFTPLVAIFCVIVLARPTLRARFGWWAVASAGALLVAFFLAKESGEAFEDGLLAADIVGANTLADHRELGDLTFVFSVLFFVTVLAAVLVARRFGSGTGSQGSVNRVLTGVVAVLGVLTLVWTIRTGHEGADVVWNGVLP